MSAVPAFPILNDKRRLAFKLSTLAHIWLISQVPPELLRAPVVNWPKYSSPDTPGPGQ